MLHGVIEDQASTMFKRKIATLIKEYKAKSNQCDQGKSSKWLIRFKILVKVYRQIKYGF